MKFGEKLIHIFFVKINKDVYDVIFVVNKCTRRAVDLQTMKSRLLFLQQFFAPLCQFFIGVHAILCTPYSARYLCTVDLASGSMLHLSKNGMRFWYSNLLYFLAIRSQISSSLLSPWESSSWSGGTCIDLIVHEHLSFNFVRSITDGA